MLASTGGRRLVVLVRRTAATDCLQPQVTRLLDQYYSSTPLERTPNPDAASYLGATCGLSPAAAAAAFRSVRISSTAKADKVVALLRRHGFSDADIARMLPKSPTLLCLDPDKVVGPKLEYLAAVGVPAAVIAQTNVLSRSLDDNIVLSIEFIRGIVGTDTRIQRAVSRYPKVLEFNLAKNSRAALEALRRHGLTEKAISELVVIYISVLKMTPSRIAGIFKDLEMLGVTITTPGFLRCFAQMCKLKSETAWRRLALYQSFGLSKDQVVKAFLTQPQILAFTDETIQRKLLFFQDDLKISLSRVIARPSAFACSMEKNILPKCAVLSVLMRDGMIQRDINLVDALAKSTGRFSERYVKKYEKDVPDVVRAYEGKIEFNGFKD
ncbi:hypothetical protein EJB05_35461, partial [Eragrostis curvula]